MIQTPSQQKQAQPQQIQIQELKHEVKQISHMNTLNRSIIQMLSSTKFGEQHIFYRVITQLLEEIDMQREQAKKYAEEKSQMIGKITILEKISNQDTFYEKTYHSGLREEIKKLKSEISEKDKKLKEYGEKIGQVDYLIGMTTKTINIFNPSEQTLKFGEEMLQVERMMLDQQEANNKLFKQNEGLIKINMVLKAQIEKKKAEIQNIKECNELFPQKFEQSKVYSHRINSSTIQSQRSMLSKQETSFAFLRFQKTLLDEESQSDFDLENLCPELSIMFPAKVQRINMKKKMLVPDLNMEKVRAIMKKNRKKMDHEARNQVHANPTQKIIDLQVQITEIRKYLSKYILKEKQLLATAQKTNRIIQELEGRNQLLVQSNRRLQENWQKLHKKYFKYQQIINHFQSIVGGDIIKIATEAAKNTVQNYLKIMNGKKSDQEKDVEKIINSFKALNSKVLARQNRSKSTKI